MKVNVVEKSPFERTLEVSVEAKRVDEAYEKAFRGAARHLALPGFRKGKVPPAMARRHIQDSSLAGQVLEDLVPEAYMEALEQEGITPVSEVQWDMGDNERGKDLTFKATFQVKPTVTLVDYKGMEITQERPEVTDEDVESALERIRQRHAQLVPVEGDRGLQEGDMALVDFESLEDGEPLPRGSASNYPMELTPGNYLQGFLDNLYGMKPGEEREFDVDFPEDYPSELAGKHVHFRFNLHEIKERRAPDLDDAFAQDVSDCQTVEELRARIRERMEGEIQHQAEHGVANQIFSRLIAQVPEDHVPPALVVQKARLYTAEVIQDLRRAGKTLQDFLEEKEMTQEQWSHHALGTGFGEARMEILVESVARQEGVEVDEAEVDAHLDQQAARTGQTRAAVRRKMEEEGSLDLLKSHLLRHQVMHVLVDGANVTYVPPQEPSPEEEGGAEEAPAEAGAASE